MERGDGGLPAWGFWDPEAEGGAYVAAEAAAASLSSYGGPSIAIASPSCAALGDRSAVSCGEPFIYGKQQQQQVMTCLKLGKRQYYDGGKDGEEAATETKRAAAAMSRGAVVPRCQVEGCNKVLVDAKDYHKRHKVCEMHSKAPCVVVLGAQQRFCQQCSRFHAISEFDDAKRSCRRRLAGHNERRRKSSSSESIMRSHSSLESTLMSSRYPYISSNSPGSALSLLSSKAASWVSTPELSSRSSAALRELIAENRAALLAKQLVNDRNLQSIAQASCSSLYCDSHQHQLPFQIPAHLSNGWNHLHGSGNHVTLDLMQVPTSSVEFLPGRNKSKDEEEECCEIWKSLEGTHEL